eukprot:TRINITY_DN44171_c0_g2_i4.p1 TRINITY_DN44171_c0_g2~~TRINITY_DN44171_c0_g2_i4.p1  ORF type:complete len:554 (+),score=17.66 TRINITY_DN44171_c0_g2_i4:109-1770(+)
MTGALRAFPRYSHCSVYNHGDACMVSGLIAVVVAFLGSLCGQKGWSRFVCPFTWGVVFIFGQRLRTMAGRSHHVFLDKLCIHQTDPEKKTASILGLAGFLRNAERLVVLWSPRYFTRLWCTYELAAWSYLHGTGERPVKFMPVVQPKVGVSLTIALSVYFVIPIVWPVEKGTWFVYYSVNFVLITCTVTPLLAISTDLIRSLRELVRMVHEYDMRNTRCFCCSHDHVHPETGAAIPCDRKLVYRTLLTWRAKMYGDAPSTTRDSDDLLRDVYDPALDQFNEDVKDYLLEVICQTTSSAFVICTYRDSVRACTPVLWAGCDEILWRMLHDDNVGMTIRWTLEYIVAWLFAMPLTLAITMQFICWVSKFTRDTRCPSTAWWLSVAVTVMVFLVSCVFVWVPGPFVTSMTIMGYPPLISDGVLVLRFILLASATLHIVRREFSSVTPPRRTLEMPLPQQPSSAKASDDFPRPAHDAFDVVIDECMPQTPDSVHKFAVLNDDDLPVPDVSETPQVGQVLAEGRQELQAQDAARPSTSCMQLQRSSVVSDSGSEYGSL